MSDEKKDEKPAAEPEGVDATDVDEVRGQLADSPEQGQLSEKQLDKVTGAGSAFNKTISNWDVSRVTQNTWDVSRVTDFESKK